MTPTSYEVRHGHHENRTLPASRRMPAVVGTIYEDAHGDHQLSWRGLEFDFVPGVRLRPLLRVQLGLHHAPGLWCSRELTFQ
eukprot:8956241-Pyramimonas_sp.AAC.1